MAGRCTFCADTGRSANRLERNVHRVARNPRDSRDAARFRAATDETTGSRSRTSRGLVNVLLLSAVDLDSPSSSGFMPSPRLLSRACNRSFFDHSVLDRNTCALYIPVMVTGHWSLVTGHWSLVTGHWSLVTGPWSLVTGHWSLVTGHWSLVTGPWSLVTGHWSLAPGLWSLVTGHWSLVTGLWSLVTVIPSCARAAHPSTRSIGRVANSIKKVSGHCGWARNSQAIDTVSGGL